MRLAIGAVMSAGPVAAIWRRSWRRPLLVTSVLAPSIIFVSAAWYDYVAEKREMENQIRATTATLAEHAQAIFETTQLVLGRMIDRSAGMTADEIAQSATLHSFMVQMSDDLPQIGSIFFVSKDGFNTATSRRFPSAPIDVSDRPYFAAASAHGSDLFVSTPIVSRVNGDAAFLLSRARYTADTFDGMFAVTVSPAYFRNVYASAVDFPGHAVATIVREDGTVLFRYPERKPLVARLPPDSGTRQAISQGHTSGWIDGPSSIDGRYRLGAFRRLDSVPVWVSYTVDSVVFMRQWLVNLLFIGAFCLTLAVALLISEWAAMRQAAADLQASRALTAETERRRRAELAIEQMQKMEALGRLTGGVAHDFNNLLTAIIGPLELAAKRTDDPRTTRLLSTAMQAAQRGARLTAQMLAFARKRDVSVGLLDPNSVITGMSDIIARTLEPMASIQYELDPAASPVAADRVQLEVALLNLCVNARDAMPEGGTVTIRTDLVEIGACNDALPPGRYVRLSVTDTGVGMTEAVRTRALEPFFTTKDPGKGTGLGLSTAYGLAGSAGGRVEIESAPGAGTTVRVLMAQREGLPAPEALMPETTVSGHSTSTILLVDDDPIVRSTTAELLHELGHTVTDVSGAEPALALLRGGAVFDLLMTDYAMPDLNGAELAKAARDLRPDLPVLFATGYADGDQLAGFSAQNTVVLAKPFSTAALANAVTAALQGRAMADGAAAA